MWEREKVSLSLFSPFSFHGLHRFETTKAQHPLETEKAQKSVRLHRKNQQKWELLLPVVSKLRGEKHAWEQSCINPTVLVFCPPPTCLPCFASLLDSCLSSLWVELVFFISSLSLSLCVCLFLSLFISLSLSLSLSPLLSNCHPNFAPRAFILSLKLILSYHRRRTPLY